jgi:hypothetical protein
MRTQNTTTGAGNTTAAHTFLGLTIPQHTPGPWEISENEAGELDICEEVGGDMLADLAKCKNAQANSRLIAAAPDLLAALRGFHPSQIKTPGELTRAWEVARAAIAKAEGRAQ